LIFSRERLVHEQLDSAKPPKDQVAMYLHKSGGKFKEKY
jgi:hypothetical protein